MGRIHTSQHTLFFLCYAKWSSHYNELKKELKNNCPKSHHVHILATVSVEGAMIEKPLQKGLL